MFVRTLLLARAQPPQFSTTVRRFIKVDAPVLALTNARGFTPLDAMRTGRSTAPRISDGRRACLGAFCILGDQPSGRYSVRSFVFQGKSTMVSEYLASLPAEQRATVGKLRSLRKVR